MMQNTSCELQPLHYGNDHLLCAGCAIANSPGVHAGQLCVRVTDCCQSLLTIILIQCKQLVFQLQVQLAATARVPSDTLPAWS